MRMAQDVVVMAFRKRLKSYGYRDVSIRLSTDGEGYQVRAKEPLAGKLIETKLGRYDMYVMFR